MAITLLWPGAACDGIGMVMPGLIGGPAGGALVPGVVGLALAAGLLAEGFFLAAGFFAAGLAGIGIAMPGIA
jgi:hypothetical protein